MEGKKGADEYCPAVPTEELSESQKRFVLKIRVPFWVPNIVRHPYKKRTPQGTII